MYIFSRLLLAAVASGSIVLARTAIRRQEYVQALNARALLAQLRPGGQRAHRPAITAWVPWHPAAGALGVSTRLRAGGYWSGVADYLRHTAPR